MNYSKMMLGNPFLCLKRALSMSENAFHIYTKLNIVYISKSIKEAKESITNNSIIDLAYKKFLKHKSFT